MADLDDFFAKKDRKKNKGKKFATADEIAKKLEETGKRSEKLKKDKSQSSQGGGQEVDEQGNTIQDEDEWRDFEEEKKDYTGLKIHNLTLSQDEGDGNNSGGEGDEDGGLEENEAGEMVPKKKQGPWRVVSLEEGSKTLSNNPAAQGEQTAPAAPVPEPPPREQPPPEPVRRPEEQKRSYVPPALRNQSQAAAPPRPYLSSRYTSRTKTAPDVRNEELFPSLSAAKSQDPTKKKREDNLMSGFEEVRNSKSHTARDSASQMKSTRLALGNKFTALDHDQS